MTRITGSCTVKIFVCHENIRLLFSKSKRHYNFKNSVYYYREHCTHVGRGSYMRYRSRSCGFLCFLVNLVSLAPYEKINYSNTRSRALKHDRLPVRVQKCNIVSHLWIAITWGINNVKFSFFPRISGQVSSRQVMRRCRASQVTTDDYPQVALADSPGKNVAQGTPFFNTKQVFLSTLVLGNLAEYIICLLSWDAVTEGVFCIRRKCGVMGSEISRGSLSEGSRFVFRCCLCFPSCWMSVCPGHWTLTSRGGLTPLYSLNHGT